MLFAQETNKAHYLRAAIVFVVCLLVTFAGPWAIWYIPKGVLPYQLEDLIYFAPQLFFPYHTLMVSTPQETNYIFSESVAQQLAFLQWSLVIVIFTLLAKRLRFRDLIPIAIITGLIVCLVTQVTLLAFNVTMILDGP
jgi:hypothetical protein